MSDDPILDELAKAAREDRARSEDLERMRDRDVASVDDEEEAFVRRVLTGGNDDALVAAAISALEAKPQQAERAPSPAVSRPEKAIERIDPSPREPIILRPRRARGQVVAFLGAAVALAAGVLLYLKQADRELALPSYEAIFEGADAPDRAAPRAGTKVSRGAGLALVARPKEPVGSPLEAAAFGGCGGTRVRLPTRVEIAPTGAARVDGTPESLFGAEASGACTLAIVVAPEGRLPQRLEDVRDDARVVESAFVVQE